MKTKIKVKEIIKLLIILSVLLSACTQIERKNTECVHKAESEYSFDSVITEKDYTPKPELHMIKEDSEFVIEYYPKNKFYVVKYGSKYLTYPYKDFELKGFWFAEKLKTKQDAKDLIDKYIEQQFKTGVTYELYKPVKN